MLSTASRNANIYIIPPGTTVELGRLRFDGAHGTLKRFREVTCYEHTEPSHPFHFVGVKAPMVVSIVSSTANGGSRATFFAQYGNFGWDGRLSGKLINNDTQLFNSVTGTFTASRTSATVAANTVTVTRAGVDVTSSVTPPEFDGITTNSDGKITAIKPTSTVGADLQVGDVLTFEVIKSGSSIGDATLTLKAYDIDLNTGMYEVMNVEKSTQIWGGIDESSNPSTAIDIKVGQTITGDFKYIDAFNVGVIAYEY